jgi:carotenoid cleavage dioxygenase
VVHQPYLATIHDFVITEKYAIWPIFPTTADLDRLKAGGAHWAHQQDLESWIAIMPRYGKVEEMKWIKGPVGFRCSTRSTPSTTATSSTSTCA